VDIEMIGHVHAAAAIQKGVAALFGNVTCNEPRKTQYMVDFPLEGIKLDKGCKTTPLLSLVF